MHKINFLKTVLLLVLTLAGSIRCAADYPADYAKAPRFKALLCYLPDAEEAHVQFDRQAISFFHKLSYGEGYLLDVTTDFGQYVNRLSDYSIVIMCNYSLHDPAQREAFERYMEQGGGWLGFHASAYNDAGTRWPWFNKFLGCGTFLCNQWPPQPALLDVEQPDHPVTRTLPTSFVCPACEFYQWHPSPRADKDVRVLLSISPKMYPFGIKDVVKGGDFPVVWTNTRYRMLYLNMGHGEETFIDATQNLLITNAFRWIVSRDPKGDPFSSQTDKKKVVAYVTSWTTIMPDPQLMTHINYAFGGVGKDGRVYVDNDQRFRQIAALKTANPQLKVLLSVGGWGRGRFSSMVSSGANRQVFARSCRAFCDQYGIDGIDIDWEFPGNNSSGEVSPADEKQNYTLLLRDLRQALGSKLLLTMASSSSPDYYDYANCIQYLDFVNVMTYDMASPPHHHAALYRGGTVGTGWRVVHESIQTHLAAGIPASKLVMGMPFYGSGNADGSGSAGQISLQEIQDGITSGKWVEHWDAVAQVPYVTNAATGQFVYGYDNARSLTLKCRYILENQLAGGMYWEYANDNQQGTERHTIYNCLMK